MMERVLPEKQRKKDIQRDEKLEVKTNDTPS